MASFLFVHSIDNRPLDLDEGTRRNALAALEERAKGGVTEHSTPTLFCAVSGRDGELLAAADRVFLREGVPMVDGRPADVSELPFDSGSSEDWDLVSGSYTVACFHLSQGRLVVARDHFGKRPAFYAESGGKLVVASECKVLQALGVPFVIDPGPLQTALLYRWVIGERHLLAPCRQVPIGGILTWEPEQELSVHQYWTPRFECEAMSETALQDYGDATDEALRRAIRAAHEAYGRVGILLSGGVDSSLLAALASQEVPSLQAFVGRIPGCEHPEEERAMKVSEMLGIECNVIDIDPAGFTDDLPHLVRRLEELPRHPNSLVVNQLYKAAGGRIDVMLEGDGTGTFWGHTNSKQTFGFQRKAEKAARIPWSVRRWLVRLLEEVPSDRAWRLARVLAWSPHTYARTLEALYYPRPVLRSLGLSLLNEKAWISGDWDETLPLDDENQAFMVRNLQRAGTVRHDRLAQPNGIAPLSPFLSSECWEVARRMPRGLRIQEKTKPVLRTLLDRYLPREVGRWPKVGFEVPWPLWLRNELAPLREEADSFLRGSPHLPAGFWDTATRIGSSEATWTGLTFYLLLREFSLLD